MLKNNRFSYFILIIFTVILGVLSRKIAGIPNFLGDILYAVMVYFGICFVFINDTNHKPNIEHSIYPHPKPLQMRGSKIELYYICVRYYNQKKMTILALLFCFCIEFLQLYRAQWIVSIRKTTLGHYALGQGFMWSDLVYYTIGIVFASVFCFFSLNKPKNY